LKQSPAVNIKRLILSALILPLALPLAAQGLPTLGKAQEITTGELPNGISYYLVSNKALPGFADFALIQPSRSDRKGPREDLVSLPDFQTRKPYRFLSDHGVSYGNRGFIQHLRDATVFRLEDVPVAEASAYDSTLLMLMNLSERSDYRQALIISGDVDVSAVRERLRILSMTVQARQVDRNAYVYGWQAQDSVAVTTSTGPVGSIRLMYRSPRTDQELMNTIQPVMSHLLASEFDIILRNRIRTAFTKEGIPLVDCRFRYTGSDKTAGDEMFTIMVDTAPDRLDDALATTAGILADLDDKGATEEEVSFARSAFIEALTRDDENVKLTNAQYLDKCISAYLYGSNLASAASLGAVFTGRKLDLGRERELLNRYMAATISPKRNLHLHVRNTVKPDPESIRSTFADGWQKGCNITADTPAPYDTTLLRMPTRKIKVRSTSTDPYSGCKVWTFANGVNVFFKKTEDKGSFEYGYMVKGGWTEIPDITAAEAACASDVLALEAITVVSGDHWRKLMEMNGITYHSALNMSDVRFTGRAPSNKLSLVLKAILATATASQIDDEAYQLYLKEMPLKAWNERFTAEGTRAILDSTMCPDYKYAAGSLPGLPGSDFAERVHSYMRKKGSNTQNAIIVLMGDLNEAATLKMVSQILGGFQPSQHRVVRPRTYYPLRECWSSTYTPGIWRDKGVTVSLSAPWAFSADGNVILSAACAALEEELAKELADKGYYFTVTGEADLLPAEKITLYINSHSLPATSLPAGIVPGRPSDALDAIRAAINRLATQEISSSALSRAKIKALAHLKASDSITAVQRDNILYRNALGRDLGSSFENRVKAVKASHIKEVFELLDACKCEFVVQ